MGRATFRAIFAPMKNILVLGAGRSTFSLIEYLKTNAQKEDWQITVADRSPEFVQQNSGKHPRLEAVQLDVAEVEERRALVAQNDLTISMLPASMHPEIAKDCLLFGKNMVTASYVSDEMKALDEEAKKKGCIFINEIGVDPGIDHLSAKKVLDEIAEEGGEMLLFESFTGGLVAPEDDDNPWNYKFTWNPRNVVLAGAGGAVKFIQEGQYKYIPYHQLFRRTEFIDIENYGRFEGYANRDSLRYRSVYGLENIHTIYRGTLRRPSFCRAWDVFVQLGMTDDSYTLEHSENMTFRAFTNTFLAYNPTDSVELKLKYYLNIPQDSNLMEKLEWLGIFSEKKIGLKNASPAQILQHILEQKWSLKKDDKDMIVMYHKFGYKIGNEKKMRESSMVVLGKDAHDTAMARTVGLPVAIAAKNVLNGNISTPGVQIPISKEIYEPMLAELADYGIEFQEKVVEFQGY